MMKKVTKTRYNYLVRNLPHEMAHPVEGHNICAMQWVDDTGHVIAQAIYKKGQTPVYQIPQNA